MLESFNGVKHGYVQGNIGLTDSLSTILGDGLDIEIWIVVGVGLVARSAHVSTNSKDVALGDAFIDTNQSAADVPDIGNHIVELALIGNLLSGIVHIGIIGLNVVKELIEVGSVYNNSIKLEATIGPQVLSNSSDVTKRIGCARPCSASLCGYGSSSCVCAGGQLSKNIGIDLVCNNPSHLGIDIPNIGFEGGIVQIGILKGSSGFAHVGVDGDGLAKGDRNVVPGGLPGATKGGLNLLRVGIGSIVLSLGDNCLSTNLLERILIKQREIGNHKLTDKVAYVFLIGV